MLLAKIGLLLSSLVSTGTAASLPSDNILQERDVSREDWRLPGAPAPLPGQSFGAYLDSILAGEGEAKNDMTPNHRRTLLQGEDSTTTQWEDGDATFSITMVDHECSNGIQPRFIAGNCLADDGVTDETNCTVRDIAQTLWNVRVAHPNSLEARNAAYAALSRAWAAKAAAEWEDVLYNGWLCPGATAHDELRRLLAIDYKWYIGSLFGSAAIGSIVGGIQVGITKATSGIDVGWEVWLNIAVGSAFLAFSAAQLGRFGPEVRGGEMLARLAFWAWGRGQAQTSRDILMNANVRRQLGTNESRCAGPDQIADPASSRIALGGPAEGGTEGGYHVAGLSGTGGIVTAELDQGQCR